MTAKVIELFPTGGLADDTIRHTINALVKGKGLRSEDVAAAAGLSRSTYFAKMSGKGSRQAFKAGEVALIAQYLGVHVSQLYDGLGGTFIPDEVSLPRLDSNQQPFVSQSTQVRSRHLHLVPDDVTHDVDDADQAA
jgi:transcriptional regulator with XRE-family HTH domain